MAVKWNTGSEIPMIETLTWTNQNQIRNTKFEIRNKFEIINTKLKIHKEVVASYYDI